LRFNIQENAIPKCPVEHDHSLNFKQSPLEINEIAAERKSLFACPSRTWVQSPSNSSEIAVNESDDFGLGLGQMHAAIQFSIERAIPYLETIHSIVRHFQYIASAAHRIV
jgi:hypothetical protein